MFNGCAVLIGPILSEFIIKEKTDYFIIFSIGGFLNIVSLTLNFFFCENRYDYGNKKVQERTSI
jgi:hypothetical protein